MGGHRLAGAALPGEQGGDALRVDERAEAPIVEHLAAEADMLNERAQLGLRLLRKDDAVEARERPIIRAGIRLQPPGEARQPRRRHAPEAGQPILGLGPRRATALRRGRQRHRDRVGHRLERDLEAVGDRFDEVGIVRAALAERRADGLAAILDARRR